MLKFQGIVLKVLEIYEWNVESCVTEVKIGKLLQYKWNVEGWATKVWIIQLFKYEWNIESWTKNTGISKCWNMSAEYQIHQKLLKVS